MSRRVRITFYGREEYVDLPASETEFQALLDAAKQLAARRRESVASHYRINISEEVAAVVAIAEIQAVLFIADAPPFNDINHIIDASRLLTEPGSALFLKGRHAPVVLRANRAGSGPLDEMVAELTTSRYGEADMGCVMLSDENDNAVFLVLDELQYALISRELLD
ncbi:MAG: hypothetical protein KY410_01385 [Proteobacteria bacterium]|nr:hypothetical protein [Pseudomonadota bacterium]